MASHKQSSILVMAMGICLIPTWAMAGADPAVIQAPPPVHRFLDGKNVGLQALNAAIMAVDLATSRRALQLPGTHEANPLMQSPGAMVAVKLAAVGAGLGISYAMHRTGHHRAERLVPVLFGIPSGIAAIHNAGIH
jgi:hypothetical protein